MDKKQVLRCVGALLLAVLIFGVAGVTVLAMVFIGSNWVQGFPF
jgi:hypothetical protein